MKCIPVVVEQLLKPAGVHDEQVIAAIESVPMEPFLLPAYRELAYADTVLPIGAGQVMNPLRDIAWALQKLQIKPTDSVLEIGTGSGYGTALLAQLGERVVSVEIESSLQKRAGAVLREQGYLDRVILEEGQGAAGWPERAPYDVIVLTGAVPQVPLELLAQLRPGGRLWAVVGTQAPMQAQCWWQEAKHAFKTEICFETYWPLLQGCVYERHFEL